MTETTDERVRTYAEAIWTASRNDEGTISATGANIVARAVITVADAELQALRAEVEQLRAENDGQKRLLLDETYRPEGGEIVMRELAKVKAERDRLFELNGRQARDIESLQKPVQEHCRRWHLPAIAERDALAARLQAVRDLHFARGRNILGQPVCNECSPLQPMPCPTLRALDASLGTPGDEKRE